MRLLLDVSAIPARPVGAGVYAINLARALAHGHPEVDLHLLTRRDDTRRWPGIAPGARYHPVVPTTRPARLAWEQVRAPAFAARLGVDVWHGPHYTLPLRLSCPPVVTVHDLTFFDHPEWHERAKVVYFRPLIRAAVGGAAVVVAVSAPTARRLGQVLASHPQVVTIPHGVDHDRFHPQPDPDDISVLRRLGVRPPYVAFVGTMEPRKAVPTLVDAFARVAARRPDLRLVLAGRDGWGTQAVRAAVARSGVATRVSRLRWVPDNALPALLRAAEVVAYPSFDEGFGLPALEALACGAPLVTSAGSPMAEVAGDAAVTVTAGDVDALADALTQMLDDDALRCRLRQRGPEVARPYTWEASARRHLWAYRLAADAGTGRLVSAGKDA